MTKFKNQIGVIYVILSAVLFGTMPLLARIAYAHGSNAYTVAFTRFFLASILLGILCLILPGNSLRLTRRQFFGMVQLSAPYALVPILLYVSYNHIDSGLATTLHFTYPIAVMLIMALFCGSRPDGKQILCAALCVGGLTLLYTPNGEISLLGVVLAVASGIVYAVYIVLLGKSSVKHLPSPVLAFWICLLASMEIGLIALCSGNLNLKIDAAGWAASLGLALFATVFALVLFQKGVFLCGEVRASLFSTFEPLTGLVLGVAVFHEVLTGKELLGVTGILAATVLLVIPVKAAGKKR